MPTNEQRRQAAKRKLERQLERRAARAKRRRQLTVALSAVAVVLAIGVVALVVVLTRGGSSNAAAPSSTSAAPPTTSAAPAQGSRLPAARKTPLAPTVDCTYPPSQAAAKPNTAPPSTGVSAQGTTNVTMATTAGDIGLTLDRAESPCTVNSFLSLTKQNYFDNTPCHRLVTTGIYVLQCGDPTGKGTGGPGYGFANEFPTDQYAQNDPAAQQPAIYPRGTIAMANSGQPNSNGSQFFLLYKDSPLPPQYTVFGTIDAPGLAVIDKVAAGGDDGSMQAGGGAPKIPVTITSMKVKA
ncbi:MAG: peptidylprolyl isomerase [Actinomycetota bacterium]|nr:peptidylprolyl isomerase [Actinomycetota bacterium]